MDRKIIKILLVGLIIGTMALPGCSDQAKDISETISPLGVAENGGITLSGIDVDMLEVDKSSDNADNSSPVPVIKKPEEIKTLADLKSLNDWDILYFYVEKMVNDRPISEYDERFAEMNYEYSWEGGFFYRDVSGEILYGLPIMDDKVDQSKILDGDEVCPTMYLSLKKLFPDAEWPKNVDEMRELLGIDMDYQTGEYEIAESGNVLSASLPEIKLRITTFADESGLVPGTYSIELRHWK